MLLLGIIKSDWHIITTSMEHNSVLRPLVKISEELPNVELDIVQCNNEGLVSVEKIKEKLKRYHIFHWTRKRTSGTDKEIAPYNT